MEGMASAIVEMLGLIGIMVIQYFLVKRPQKWMAFILPAIYFAISMKNVFTIVQSGEIIVGGMFGTALLIFLAGNMVTCMLLMIWWKKDFDKSTIAIAVFAVYILWNVVLALLLMLAGFFGFLANEEVNPSPNVGGWYYEATENESASYPVMLEDLGVEPMAYRYTQQGTEVMPNFTESEYVDSMVNDVENPTKIVTIDYEIRVAKPDELDSREKTLQKRYDGEPEATVLDYGAEASYWLGDNLLLRFEDCIVYFEDSSSRGVLESETAAEFFREEFEVVDEYEKLK